MLLELCLTLVASPPPTRFAHESDPMERARLVKLLDSDDTQAIVATFRAHPGATLPFVDSFLEGGLARLEKQGEAGREAMTTSFKTGVRFAALADEAFATKSFHPYASAFAGWNATEQASFREGQKAYRDGMQAAKKDAAAGLASLARSGELATKLGDTWGRAMVLQASAEIELALGDAEHLASARTHATAASELHRDLRLVDDWANSLRTLAAVQRAAKQKPLEIYATLRAAWSGPLALPGADPAQGRAIGEELVAACEAAESALPNAKDELARLRRELDERFPKSSAPPAGK